MCQWKYANTLVTPAAQAFDVCLCVWCVPGMYSICFSLYIVNGRKFAHERVSCVYDLVCGFGDDIFFVCALCRPAETEGVFGTWTCSGAFCVLLLPCLRAVFFGLLFSIS